MDFKLQSPSLAAPYTLQGHGKGRSKVSMWSFFFSIAELSCFKCSWLTLLISTPPHFPSCQMSPSPWVLLTLSFVQAAFWSPPCYYSRYSKALILLISIYWYMSASLFISCGYPPWPLWHRSFLLFILTTSLLFGDCLLPSSPYNLSYVCSVPCFLEVILEEESSYSVQLCPPPWATYPLDLHIQLGSVTSSKPACHSLSGSPFRSTIHLSPRPETWDLS